ncbi:Uu.00g002290.m01.CDS01 [Anthostomella pinea]|uniref:Uu.00g002290.m01.CDS01 n=1 Tax=Anthostomella pinea TaxID=933095 RepID=A0AAI8VJG3_9PEZI|nr:Uu.00g002290.m01.CDS01 [Anthostomella pinea]
MASVASASPTSRPSFHRSESADDSDSWQYVESNPSSVGFVPSPASSSMNSWGIVGYANQLRGSPTAMSPLHLDHDQHHGLPPPPTSYPDHTSTPMMPSTGVDGQLMSPFHEQRLMSSQEMMFGDPLNHAVDMSSYYSSFPGDMADMSGLEPLHLGDLGIPQQYRNDGDVPPWAPHAENDDMTPIMMNDVNGHMSQSPTQLSPTQSSHYSSPTSPHVKLEPSKSGSPIRKVRGSVKVEKRKSESPSKFVIMTPNLINQQSGKPNPFECFEALRTTQRGRKGPLANEIKESALQVRRLGACFCCHSRKVKCDKERPCKNCKKLTAQIPQIMCWQFGDFLPALFPDFIRGHFKKDQVASFIGENVESFGVDGVEQGFPIELFSGMRFNSTLTIPASFFTPKTAEILQHWHMNTGVNQMDLQSRGAAPIGIDPNNSGQRDELKRRAREYIQNLTHEPLYAEQVTDSVRSTQLPRKVLTIVQNYAQRTDSMMVKRALSIYVMHYVLTRQLCLTHNTIISLQHTNMVPQNNPWVTTRVLNRQVKSMLDEMLLKEMQALFDTFSKSLKPKSKREWAPCLAAFLVLCLFMEAVETAADTFVVSQNEIAIRNHSAPEYSRDFALGLCREIDNMPFKQFAYQFHQIYQTHSRDAATRPFNPLLDDSFALQGELDAPAMEMVHGLKQLMDGDGCELSSPQVTQARHELEFLVADPILTAQETHPYPRDVTMDYTGRLLARFLLSFTDERYLFDGQY